MKTSIIIGSVMFLTGVLSIAVIHAGTMANDWTINGELSSIWNITNYGLMPAIYILGWISIVGFTLAIWGVFEKSKLNKKSKAVDIMKYIFI